MRVCLREAVRALRLVLIARAFAGLTLPAPRAGQTRRPSSTRPGFRRAARRSGELRHMIGDALAGVHEGTLRARAERLRDILDNLEPLILRVRARMLALFSRPIGAGLVLIAAFDALVRIAQAPTPACADTS